MSVEDCEEIEKILWSDQTKDFKEVSDVLRERKICALDIMHHPFFQKTEKLFYRTLEVMPRVFVLSEYKKLKKTRKLKKAA